MKNLWIIANWKSNKTIKESLEWVDLVGPKLVHQKNVKVVVCPSFVAVSEVKKRILSGGFPIMVGVQDLSRFSVGAYTGEVAASLISEVAELAIIGHSERRGNFHETDEVVGNKVKQAQQNNILSLVCIQNEKTPIPEGAGLIAYEPVFAIGTGNPDTPENAGRVATLVNHTNGSVYVLYGGSISAENAERFLHQEMIHGLLIGKSSLNPEEFVKIIQIAYSA